MYLNEFLDYKRSDPDLVERNVQMIHNFDTGIKPLNRIIQDIMLFTMVISWRWYYYGCNTYDHYKNEKLKIDRGANWRMVFPFLFTHLTVAERRDILINVYIKYLLSRVIYFIPVMILCTQIGIPITTGFYYYTINMMIAEFLSNIHTFLIIVTNHCGSDLYKFSKPVSTHDELIYRAIIGSTNYPQNGFFSDFLHGYLNYQIEHHIFPDKTPYFYEQFAPKVREICQKHNVPYVSGNVWERFLETRKIILGDAEMMLMID
jgi:fatty acid desaturase